MAEYYPDGWVILKITDGKSTLYRLFGSWSGSYLSGACWKLNSGITSFEEDDGLIEFNGYSGSTYVCNENLENRINVYNSGILETFKKQEGVSQISFEDFKKEFVPNVS